jgi:hypothetical protein
MLTAVRARRLWRIAEAFRSVTPPELAPVLRPAAGKQALLLEASRFSWRPRGEIFDIHQTGDARWLQLHSALPHRRKGITNLLGSESTRKPAAAAVHARLSARNNVGRGGCTSTIEFPVPVDTGAQATT